MMLNLDNSDLLRSSGDGAQRKVWVGGWLYKLNSKKREADKEVDASRLGEVFGLPIVEYFSEDVFVYNQKRRVCKCKSFLDTECEVLIPMLQVFNVVGIDINQCGLESSKDFYNTTVEALTTVTGFSGELVDGYLKRMLVFDYIICNTDRHFNNFGVIQNIVTGEYRFAPLFDNGDSFLNTSAELSINDILARLRKIKSKPFSTKFTKNIIDLEQAKEIAMGFVSNMHGKGVAFDKLTSSHTRNRLIHLRVKQILGGLG